MDYIREFDIRLEKEMFYAGETLSGVVVLDTIENFKVRAIRVMLRGKAHTEWNVIVSGDRRTVKDDQYFIEDRAVIWGKEKAEGNVPILPRGMHQFPFRFALPESSLPCSFESRPGQIRYYLKVTVDVPYASPPQGMKYFTVIGPWMDVMDYLRPIRGETKRRRCCLCCESGKVSLRTDIERSAYVCGESLRVKADIDNQSEEEVRLKLRLMQHVEYYIDRGVLGVQKEVSNTILEYRGAPINPHTRSKWDSQQNLVVPTMPPTLVGVCRLIQIYYVLKVNVELEKSGEDLHMHFPISIATVPFRIPNSNQTPTIVYDVACDHCEGGMYIGPEFLLGQVYDGTNDQEEIVLYRPVYPTVMSTKSGGNVNNSSVRSKSQSKPSSGSSTPNASKGLKVTFPKEPSSSAQNEPNNKPVVVMEPTSSTNNKNPATPSNSNSISATAPAPNSSTKTSPGEAIVVQPGSEASPNGGNSSVVSISSKSLQDPCSSSSCTIPSGPSSSVLPGTHTTGIKPRSVTAKGGKGTEASKPLNTGVSGPDGDGEKEKVQAAQVQVHSSTSASKRSRVLSSTSSVESSSAVGPSHVSFSKATTGGENNDASKPLASTSSSKRTRNTSTSSSGGGQSAGRERTTSASDSEPKEAKVTSPGVDSSSVIALETERRDGGSAKSRGDKENVLPGKVVKVETPS